MNTTTSSVQNPDALILVEIPHQMPAKVYSFANRAEALKRITRHHVSNEYNWQRYGSAAEWSAFIVDCFGSDWAEDERAARLHAEGLALFAAGAKAIVERAAFGSSNPELIDEAKAGDELEWAFNDARHDLHAAYLLTREETLEWLADGNRGTHHQALSWRRQLRHEAEMLDWVQSEPVSSADDEEGEE